MRVKHTDKNTLELIDDAAMSFMALTVHRLNEALKESGVSKAKRRSTCESFLFDFAYHHDAGWLEHAGRRLYPVVTFAVRKPAGGDLGDIQELHVPTDASSWHEYAMGVVSHYFEEEGESPGDLKSGSYDLEDEEA
jgi:hypothetical protein